jgi:hypothetical protein
MQEPPGIERRDMAITNNTPGEALWTRGYPTEDHQIRSGSWNPSVKSSENRHHTSPTKMVLTIYSYLSDKTILLKCTHYVLMNSFVGSYYMLLLLSFFVCFALFGI